MVASPSEPFPDARPHRTAIIVVHGVGDTAPGETLNYVVDQIGTHMHGLRSTGFNRTRNLPELRGLLVRTDESFPVQERDLRLGDGTEATAYELYWADLTRLRGAGLWAGLGVLRTLFETPHVVDALLRHRPDPLSRILRPLLLLATNFLRGPLAGFCATLFAGAMIFLSYYYIPNREPLNAVIKAIGGPAEAIPYFLTYKVYFSLMLLLFGAGGFWLFRALRDRDVGFADLGLFSGLFAITIVLELHLRSLFAPELSAVLRDLLPVGQSGLEPINWMHSGPAHLAAFKLYYPRLTVLWQIWAGLMALAIAVYVAMWILDVVNRRDGGPRGAGLGIGLAVIQATTWLATIPVLGVLMIDSVRSVFTSEFDRQMFHAVLQAIQAVQDVPTSTWDQLLNDYNASARGLDPMIGTALRELTLSFLFNGAMLLTISILAVLCLFGRYLHIRHRTRVMAKAQMDWADVGRSLPRLIANTWLILFLIALGVTQAVLIITHDWNQRPPAPEIFVPIGLAIAGFLFVATRALRPYMPSALGGVLHIAQDLIDHHYRTRVGFSGYLRLKSKVPDVESFPRRERISNRMHAVIDTLIQTKDFDDVLFLAHSQGSVIVFDYLNDLHNDPASHPGGLLLGRYRPYVITVGSPLGHLYRHYFDDYRRLDQSLAALRPAVSRWINIYRCDDPIAGPVRGLDPDLPQNMALSPGGHLAYWAEPEVAARIGELLEQAVNRDLTA